MGLAPYGRPRYLDKLLGPILKLDDSGAFALNERFFDFCSHERHYDPVLVEHLGIPPRTPEDPDAARNITISPLRSSRRWKSRWPG